MDARLFGEVFVTLLVIIDPPGMLPIFLALTRSMPHRERARAAWMAVALAGGVIVVFAVAGQQILDYLGVDLPALQAAGGLLLLLVALELLTGRSDDSRRQVTANVALVPLGTPLMAGPGAIVATMLFVQQAADTADYVATQDRVPFRAPVPPAEHRRNPSAPGAARAALLERSMRYVRSISGLGPGICEAYGLIP